MKCSIRKSISLIAVICIILNVLCSCGKDTGDIRSDRAKPYVAVITKSTTSQYWKTTFAGANAAGAEYNLEVTFDGPENEEDYETQNSMIREAFRPWIITRMPPPLTKRLKPA